MQRVQGLSNRKELSLKEYRGSYWPDVRSRYELAAFRIPSGCFKKPFSIWMATDCQSPRAETKDDCTHFTIGLDLQILLMRTYFMVSCFYGCFCCLFALFFHQLTVTDLWLKYRWKNTRFTLFNTSAFQTLSFLTSQGKVGWDFDKQSAGCGSYLCTPALLWLKLVINISQ